MDSQAVLDIIRDGIYVLLIIGAPPMAAALAVGLIVSLFQALTQIQEQTLTFVPKIVATLLTLVLFLPFMLNTLTEFTNRLTERIVHVESDDADTP